MEALRHVSLRLALIKKANDVGPFRSRDKAPPFLRSMYFRSRSGPFPVRTQFGMAAASVQT